jgi:hypothetical protein
MRTFLAGVHLVGCGPFVVRASGVSRVVAAGPLAALVSLADSVLLRNKMQTDSTAVAMMSELDCESMPLDSSPTARRICEHLNFQSQSLYRRWRRLLSLPRDSIVCPDALRSRRLWASCVESSIDCTAVFLLPTEALHRGASCCRSRCVCASVALLRLVSIGRITVGLPPGTRCPCSHSLPHSHSSSSRPMRGRRGGRQTRPLAWGGGRPQCEQRRTNTEHSKGQHIASIH